MSFLLVLIGLFAFGLYMSDLPLSPDKLKFYSWHKWAGVTVFLLAMVRLAWRISHRAPALPASMPKLMQFAADAGPFVPRVKLQLLRRQRQVVHVEAQRQHAEEQDGHQPVQALGGGCIAVCHGRRPYWGKNE